MCINVNMSFREYFNVFIKCYIFTLFIYAMSSFRNDRNDGSNVSINNYTNKINYDVGFHQPSHINSIFHVNKYTNENQDYIIKFLTKINEGHRLISDICEGVDEKGSLFSESLKPSWAYDVSYIKNNTIVLKNISNKIRNFMIDQKGKYCKLEKIECGELIIGIKFLDLINSAILVVENNNDSSKMLINLKIIDFDILYDVFKNSLFDINILTNITLAKQKANVILINEKFKLKKELNKQFIDLVSERLYNTLGNPIQNIIHYTTTTITKTAHQIIPELNLETKVIILLVLVIILIKK